MKIISTTVRYGYKKYLGNFETEPLEIEETAQVGPDEDIEEVRKELFENLKAFVHQQLRIGDFSPSVRNPYENDENFTPSTVPPRRGK